MENGEADKVATRNNVKVLGTGKRTLMLGHGFGCDQNTWRLLLPYLNDKFQIVVFDYVGAGKSDLSAYTTQRYSNLDGYALDVVEICQELDLQDVIFVGHSVSSMIGILSQKMKPDLFKSLIFIGPSPRYLNADDYRGGIDKHDLDGLLEVMDNNYQGWSRMLAPKIMGNPQQPELSEQLAESFCATDPTIAKQFARVTFLSDNRNDLPGLNIPSLTIQCEEDFLTSAHVAAYIQSHTPNNQLTMLTSTGHCPHLSDAQGVAKAMMDFLDQ